MQATPVAVGAQAENPDFGATTTILIEGTRLQKLLRFRHLKAQLRDLRSEYALLERELFTQAPS